MVRQTLARMLKLGHIVWSIEWVDNSFSCSLMPSFGWLLMYFRKVFHSIGTSRLTKCWHYKFITKHWFCRKLSTIVLKEGLDAFITTGTTVFWRLWHFLWIENTETWYTLWELKITEHQEVNLSATHQPILQLPLRNLWQQLMKCSMHFLLPDEQTHLNPFHHRK